MRTLLNKRNLYLFLVFVLYCCLILLFAYIYYNLYQRRPNRFTIANDDIRQERIENEKFIINTELNQLHREVDTLKLYSAFRENQIGCTIAEQLKKRYNRGYRPDLEDRFYQGYPGEVHFCLDSFSVYLVVDYFELSNGKIKNIYLKNYIKPIGHQINVLQYKTFKRLIKSYIHIKLPSIPKNRPKFYQNILQAFTNNYLNKRDSIEKEVNIYHAKFKALQSRYKEGLPKLTFGDFIYFSTITQSSTGFGDILPNSQGIRLLVACQIIFGLVLLSVIINFTVQRVIKERKDKNL